MVASREPRVLDIAAQFQIPKHEDYAPTEFLAHLIFGHCDNAVLQMIAQATESYGNDLDKSELKRQRLRCQGCHLASNTMRNQSQLLCKLIGQGLL